MRIRLLALALIVAAVTPLSLHAQDHAAHHPAPAASASDTAQRWAADATLRRNMDSIRKAVEALGHYERGHMVAEQAVTQATTVEGHINAIIAQCQLPPDADAALHAILAPLMTGAATLKQDPKRLDVIPPMRAALVQYERQFDHTRVVEDAPEPH